MTTSRIVRGTKARITIGLCAVLAVTAIIACYNSTLKQLDVAKRSSDICHQQEENLSTQLQVISEYKQRLEKSLKTEQAEHKQSRTSLELKLNETQIECKKSSADATVRFKSLQQHFNMLETQHHDYKENCSKIYEKQTTDLNELQNKLQELQKELDNINKVRDNLQVQITELQNDNQHLQQVPQNSDSELRKELESLRQKCGNFEALPAPVESSSATNILLNNSNDSPGLVGPKPESNDNFMKQPTKSTTSSSNLNNPSLNGVPPLLVPSVTPENANKKLPEGVVPAPDNIADKNDKKIVVEENNELQDNRYANKIEKKEDIPEMYDALAFGENDGAKSENKVRKEIPLEENANNDLQMEENDPDDDDPEDYVGPFGKAKDSVVRN